MKRFIAIAIAIAVSLSGCSMLSSSVREHTPEPIEQEVSVVSHWSNKVGGGAKGAYLVLKPAVTTDRIYSSDAKGVVAAMDRETGDVIWRTKVKQPLTSGPGVGKHNVYIGTSDAQVIALDVNDGHEVWKVDVPNQVLASPKYAMDSVLVKTINGQLLALDAKTGAQRWAYGESSPRLVLRASSSPAITYPWVVAGFADGQLVALSLDKGQMIWQETVTQPSGFSDLSRMVDIDADPIIRDGVIYVVTYQGTLSALKLQTGETLWEHELSSYAGLAIAYRHLFVSDADGHLWAFDPATGAVVWRQNDLEGRAITGPSVLGPYVLVADCYGYVHWMSQQDGHFVARQYLGKSGIIAQPVSQGDDVYVSTADGSLYDLRLAVET